MVLVGLSGSGKSTVGRLVAKALGAEVRDIDARIEKRSGLTVREIFATRGGGEAEFRELERLETVRALEGEPAVIVPGGGWAAQPGNLDALGERALTVYLETAAATAIGRTASEETRPLLAGVDPAAQMAALLARREPYYKKCHARVSTDAKSPDQVAREVVELARRGVGG